MKNQQQLSIDKDVSMKRKTKHHNLEALLITVPQGKKPPRGKKPHFEEKAPWGGKNLKPQKRGQNKNKGPRHN